MVLVTGKVQSGPGGEFLHERSLLRVAAIAGDDSRALRALKAGAGAKAYRAGRRSSPGPGRKVQDDDAHGVSVSKAASPSVVLISCEAIGSASVVVHAEGDFWGTMVITSSGWPCRAKAHGHVEDFITMPL